MMISQKPQFGKFLSFPRRREISNDFDLVIFNIFWIPACAGMTEQDTFCDTIIVVITIFRNPKKATTSNPVGAANSGQKKF